MSIITKHYCDKCGSEIVKEEDIKKESTPIIKEVFATGGRSQIKLCSFGYQLEFEDKEYCPSCYKKYKQIWTKAMIDIYRQWELVE